MEPVIQTPKQKATEARARAAQKYARKVSKTNEDRLRAALREGRGEEFRVQCGWSFKSMVNRCNKVGVGWEEMSKRAKKSDHGQANPTNQGYANQGYANQGETERSEMLAAIRAGRGAEYQQEKGLSDYIMRQRANHLGIGWADYDKAARDKHDARRTADEQQLATFISTLKKASCDGCRLALMGADPTKAVACKDRHRPVNGSCPEYSRRLELFK